MVSARQPTDAAEEHGGGFVSPILRRRRSDAACGATSPGHSRLYDLVPKHPGSPDAAIAVVLSVHRTENC